MLKHHKIYKNSGFKQYFNLNFHKFIILSIFFHFFEKVWSVLKIHRNVDAYDSPKKKLASFFGCPIISM